MAKLVGLALCIALGLCSTTVVWGYPGNINQVSNNPNTVAYYPNGSHTVISPNDSILYDQSGLDYVKLNDTSGNAQQWYLSGEGINIHSIFKDVGDDTSCSPNWTYIGQANPGWGSYFVAGDNYCVHSNNF